MFIGWWAKNILHDKRSERYFVKQMVKDFLSGLVLSIGVLIIVSVLLIALAMMAVVLKLITILLLPFVLVALFIAIFWLIGFVYRKGREGAKESV